MLRIVTLNQIVVFIMLLMSLAGCSKQPITIDDLYLESWTALEAYKHGKYTYIPASKEIAVTTKIDGNQFKVTAVGIVQNRKTVLNLTYPKVYLSKKDSDLRGANEEFDALKKCMDKSANGSSAMDSCSVTALIINGDSGSSVSDQLHAPHMDMWVNK